MNKSIRYYLLKWWLWPLVLIVLQIIQYFIIRNCNNVGTDVPDSVIRVVNFRDPIAIISIILIIANLCLWIYYMMISHSIFFKIPLISPRCNYCFIMCL